MAEDPMRWVRRATIGFVLVVGWLFIAFANHFHLTAPVVFVCLGYLAAVAVLVNLWKTGAMAVAPEQIGEDAWERPIGPREELEKEKKTLLKAIKEAEFDLEMGKLSKVDADGMIAQYRTRAIAVIKELDRMDGVKPASKRDAIEREVKARISVEKEEKKAKKKSKAKEASP